MRRREYIAALVAGTAVTAGCLGDAGEGSGTSPAPGTTSGTGADTTPGGAPATNATPPGSGPGTATRTHEPVDVPNLRDVQLPLDSGDMVKAVGKDAIPAITEPVFGADWSGVSVPGYTGEAAEPRLEPSDRVIGVERDGRARAYPLLILNNHEVVNDEFGGPLLVSYCPLCGAGVTAVRRVDGQVTQFGVSGYLWRSDLVMYDALTDSLWSQILATAVRGPQTGQALELLPSTLTTWGTWRADHPDTAVLRPPPESKTVGGAETRYYAGNPYAGYGDSRQIGIGYNDFEDDRLHPKVQVLGVTVDGTARAYPLPAVRQAGVVNDAVAGRPIVVAAGPSATLVAYERTVDGETLRFHRADEGHLVAGGSRWALVTGRAVDGPHVGTTLVPANDRSPMFWFAWLDFHPETGLYGQ